MNRGCDVGQIPLGGTLQSWSWAETVPVAPRVRVPATEVGGSLQLC